jgi:hypothetical protein
MPKTSPQQAQIHESWTVSLNKLLLSRPELTEPYMHPSPETYDVASLCKSLTLERADFSHLVGKKPQDVQHYWEKSSGQIQIRDSEVRSRIRELLGLRILLSMLSVDEKAVQRWLRTPNPSMSNKTPVELIREDDSEKVASILVSLLQGNMTA